MAPVHAVPRLLERAGPDAPGLRPVRDPRGVRRAGAVHAEGVGATTAGRSGDDRPRSKLNVAGGSLAAGHPFAATGGRILATAAKLLAEQRLRPRAGVDLRRRRPGRRRDRGACNELRPLAHARRSRTSSSARTASPRRSSGRSRRTTTASEEFPWPVLEEAAEEGFYNPLFYRDLIGDPTGLSLPLFMEELFWGCAGIGLSIVMPALALSAMAQAATPEQLLRWAPECFGEPGDLKLAALCVSEPEGGSDVRNLRTHAPPRRRRVGARRPQDLDRQRRDRRRARGQRDGRPGARPPRPGAVHRPGRDARAASSCASSRSSAAAPRTPPS